MTLLFRIQTGTLVRKTTKRECIQVCGIYGILSWKDVYASGPEIMGRMGETIVHRGPDSEGKYEGNGIVLGMRRLAIIDPGGGSQPISNEDGTLWLVCNGEIYNFRPLRRNLVERGHRFRSGSDSEVILHLYEEYGDSFIDHLEGMFGFALWDARRKRLLVGRDRLGIKPVYYYKDDARLIFASEAKAILDAPAVKAEISPEGLCEYLALGYTPTPHSMFRNIRKLPPASILTCESGRCDIKKYWRQSDRLDEELSENEWIEALRTQLEESVVSQMVSDVPLGAFLSGGIDSSCVVGIMARHSEQPIRTYSIGFGESSGGGYYNELPYARRVSEIFGTNHKEIVVKPDIARLLPQLIWHMDEPIADAAFITTYLVSRFASQEVKVILSGVGGDEILGGYRRYLGEYYRRYYNRIPEWLRRRIVSPLAYLLPSDRHSPLLNLSRYVRSFILSNEMPFEERYRAYIQVFGREQRKELLGSDNCSGSDALTKAFLDTRGRDAMARLSSVDISTQLVDDLLMLTDKMSMAASLECRVPLLDDELVNLSARMPSRFKIKGRTLKYVFKQALGDLLPDDILHRKKRGFGAPMGAWLKHELSALLDTVLSRESVESRGLLNWRAVKSSIELHKAGREDYTDHLLSLMNLEIWCRLYLDSQSPDDLADQIAL